MFKHGRTRHDVITVNVARPGDREDRHVSHDPESLLTKEQRVRRRALVRENNQRFLAEHPNHPTIEHIVDNRVFLLGLDALYRERMKRHESTKLLACARAVTAKLDVRPADVPIEGYYTETRRLTEYFRLVRCLQAIKNGLATRVSNMREFQRLASGCGACAPRCALRGCVQQAVR